MKRIFTHIEGTVDILTSIKGSCRLVTEHPYKIQTVPDHYQYHYRSLILTWNY